MQVCQNGILAIHKENWAADAPFSELPAALKTQDWMWDHKEAIS